MRGALRLGLLLLAVAVVLPLGVWAAGGGGQAESRPRPRPSASSASPPTGPAPRPVAPDLPEVEFEGDPAASVAPARVRVPVAGIDVGTERLRLDDRGRLRAPRAWQRAGWWAAGPAPGDVGPAVLAGHVDSPTGPAAFTGLGAVRPGDLVVVERVDGSTVRFAVDRSAVVAKDDFPTAAVYGPTPDRQLRLVTCDGPYLSDAGGYQANLVVWASAVED